MGIAFFGQFARSLVGPVLGGVVANSLGWRATFWCSFIYGVIIFVFVFLFMAETYRVNIPVLPPPPKEGKKGLRRGTLFKALIQMSSHRDEIATEDFKKPGVELTMAGHRANATSSTSTSSDMGYIKRFTTEDAERAGSVEMDHVWLEDDGSRKKDSGIISPAVSPTLPSPSPSLSPLKPSQPVLTQQKKPMFFPFRPLSNLRYPFVVLIIIPGSIGFATMFVYQVISPAYFKQIYHLNSFEIGLTYLSGGFANILGSLTGDALAKSKAKRGYHIPEDRITINALICISVVLPAGCLLFGFSLQQRWNLAGPVIATGLLNFGMNQVLLTSSSYLIDAVPAKSASAAALLAFVRCTASCILGIVSDPMKRDLGPHGISAVLAGLNFVATLAFVVAKFKGEAMRKRANILQVS